MRETPREVNGRKHTFRIRFILADDVVCGAVVRRRANEGKAEGPINSSFEADHFQRCETLVMIHRDHRLVMTMVGVIEKRVCREGAYHVNAERLRLIQRRDNCCEFFGSDLTAFPSMGIQPTDCYACAWQVEVAAGFRRKFNRLKDFRSGDLVGKLDQKADFIELAKIYSQGSQAQDGGDWGWVQRSVLNTNLAQVAFSLEPGQHSRAIETPAGAYVLLVEDKKVSHIKTLSEVRDDIEATLRAEEIKRLRKQWIDQLKSKAFVRSF